MSADLNDGLPSILDGLKSLQQKFGNPDGPAFLIVQYVQPDKGLASAKRLGLKKTRTFAVRDTSLVGYIDENLKASRSMIVVGWLGGDQQRWETYVES